MKVLQINLNSILRKKEQFGQFLQQNNFLVACGSETFLKPGEIFSIPNFNIIRSDRNTTTYGGKKFSI